MPPADTGHDEALPEAFERGLVAAGLSDSLRSSDRRLLYAELKIAARKQRNDLGAPPTLQTTAVVHEAWLRLRDSESFVDHAHFMASAALAMRYVIVDYIREQSAAKRRKPESADTLDEPCAWVDQERHHEILGVHAALDKLAELDARSVRVIECRYFAGYTSVETATALNIDERTVRRDWEFARAWLRERLNQSV